MGIAEHDYIIYVGLNKILKHTESNLLGLASKSFTFEKVSYSKKARRNQVRLFETHC